MAKQNTSLRDQVVNVIGTGIDKAIASAIKIIPGAEKHTAKKIVSYLQKEIPSVFEYIGKSIIEGTNPQEFGINSPVLYHVFENVWKKTHDSKFPEYNQQ